MNEDTSLSFRINKDLGYDMIFVTPKPKWQTSIRTAEMTL